MEYLLIAAGLAALTAGADLLVRGAAGLAARFGLSPLAIGLTVVAYGTSAPELSVSVQAALRGSADLALGNVLGSNIFNTFFILGLSALIVPLAVAQPVIRLDVWVMTVVSAAVWAMSLDGELSRGEGWTLLLGAAVYTGWTLRAGSAADAMSEGPPPSGFVSGAWRVALGLALLVGGSRALVEGATGLARQWGVGELMIGLTIVAAGTSLPELATSLAAALRGERDIAVGNVVGSNIFNLLAVLGGAAAVGGPPIAVAPSAAAFDLPVALASAVACLPIFFSGRRIDRWEGVVFLGCYVGYVAYLAAHARSGLPPEAFRTSMLFFLIPLTLLSVGVIAWRARRERLAA